MINENMKYFQKFVKIRQKTMFLPQNKGHISYKSKIYVLNGSVSSYDATS